MYKAGDRFIIEIEEVFTGKATGYPQYRIKGFDKLVMDDRGLVKLSKFEDKQEPRCADCRFFHKLKHNFEVGKGFEESHCCTIMIEHDFEPPVKDITWVQEVEEDSRCEMFTER